MPIYAIVAKRENDSRLSLNGTSVLYVINLGNADRTQPISVEEAGFHSNPRPDSLTRVTQIKPISSEAWWQKDNYR